MGLCYTCIAAKEQVVVTSLEVLFRVKTTWRLRGVCNIPKNFFGQSTLHNGDTGFVLVCSVEHALGSED